MDSDDGGIFLLLGCAIIAVFVVVVLAAAFSHGDPRGLYLRSE
jgi:hypothetical protein